MRWSSDFTEVVHLTFTTVLRKGDLQLVLEKMKEALMDIIEFEPYYEKFEAIEPSACVPDRVSVLEDSDYDAEYRKMNEDLSHIGFTYLDVEEEYSSGIRKASEIDSKETPGATFFVNMGTRRMRIVILRKPLKLSALVHELLNIIEDYLNLPLGVLSSRCSQSVADRLTSHYGIILPNNKRT